VPVARFVPGEVGAAKGRNPVWLVAGVVLVVACALAGALLFSRGSGQRDVVVAAKDVTAGVPVGRGDLRVVRMSVPAGVSTLSPVEASGLVGQRSSGRVPAGTLLNPAMFATVAPVADGEMVFGAALHPGAAPLSSITVGATVELLSAGKPDTAAAAAVPVPAMSLGTGVVWAVEALASGDVWVSVRVARPVGLLASQADQEHSLRIVLAGGTAAGGG
jgi:SAF domain